MQRVIYADVLVVTNVYVTCFLLKAAALLSGVTPDRIRLLLASALGGVYSLTVLLPEGIQSFFSATRLFSAMLFVFVAFGFVSLKAFLRLGLSFVFCSLVLAGLMLALWYFICPAGMYFNGSVIYFDIDVLTLVLFTIGFYIFMKLFDRLFRTRAPVNTVFFCRVVYEGSEYRLKCFLDTGNRLRDYFTGKPVIIAYSECFSDAFPGGVDMKGDTYNEKIRYIFCDTLNGKGMLPSFSPEKVYIKGAESDFFTDKVTVALTDKRLLQGEYDAILPSGLFDENFDRKDEGESEKASVSFKKNKGRHS